MSADYRNMNDTEVKKILNQNGEQNCVTSIVTLDWSKQYKLLNYRSLSMLVNGFI